LQKQGEHMDGELMDVLIEAQSKLVTLLSQLNGRLNGKPTQLHLDLFAGQLALAEELAQIVLTCLETNVVVVKTGGRPTA